MRLTARMERWALLLVLGGLLVACANPRPAAVQSATHPSYYVVQRGDNLFRIAWRYGLDYHQLAAWNHLASPDRIQVGQRLRLSPPGRASVHRKPVTTVASTSATSHSAPPAAAITTREVGPGHSSGLWDWPTKGKLVSGFDPSSPGGKGIDISGHPGQPVLAAAGGRVVYRGSGLRGYGRLIIVKHRHGLLSAYGYLGRIYVKEGERVSEGQKIAVMGNDSNPPVLHFEIRKNGRPVDPLHYLPG